MEITLKNVKFSERFSRETNCFTASIYANGILIGSAENEGHGGSTFVRHDLKNKTKYLEAEKYVSKQPKINIGSENDPYFVESNMESLVDSLFEKWLIQKELDKIKKKFVNHIVWQIGDNPNYHLIKYNYSIEHYLSVENGLEIIKNRIAKIKADGGTILNDNLGKLI